MTIIPQALQGLNPEQLEFAQHIYGPCLAVAGPGSGKTHTVVSRAEHMINSGISPDNMLMFSFTKKAAGEMKERIIRRIPSAQTMTVGTYHSFCSRLLRKYAHYIGFEQNFTIYDTEDSKKVLKEIANDPFYKPEIILSTISGWKSKMITPLLAMEQAQDSFQRKIASFYTAYQKALKEQNAMDFDDLISWTIVLLQDNPSVKAEVNERYQYITTDETQDSSKKDLELIRLLAGDAENVCMIMDDCQSIYSFRGADIEAVLGLSEIFPDLKQYLLTQNYRSTSTIVGASMNLISYNHDQIEKHIFTDNAEGEKIVYMECNNQQDESARVMRMIKGLVKNGEYQYKDIAILYRLSYLSRIMEDQLLSNSIPYTVIGGTPFYGRKEVKDIMAYVRILYNNRDKQAFERVVNLPKRSIGEKTIEKIVAFSNQHFLKEGFLEASKSMSLKGKAKTGIGNFNEIIRILLEKYHENCTPRELVEAITETIQYERYLKETDPEAEDRLQNIQELFNIADQYETIEDFIYSMSLNSVEEEGAPENKVQLLTMHASKGLEFPVVIVVGANEGVCPHHKAETTKKVDEERRLFYVAVSRAEKLLFITRPKLTTIRGQTMFSKESRFIKEMGEDYLMQV